MDRLSSLSDDVLAHTLSFLDIESAVQTSVLSSRWKYLYMFTTGLNIDCSRIQLSSHIYDIDRVVMQHKANVKKLILWSPFYYGSMEGSIVNSWIDIAVSRGVEELKLCNDFNYDWAPAGCLFISHTLVVFNLSARGTILIIPSSVWLPSLKILHMTRIEFLDSSSMTRLFDGCPMLQDLSLDSCNLDDGQVYAIRAPMLRCLRIIKCGNIYYPTWMPKVDSLRIPSSVWLPSLKNLHMTGISFLDSCSMIRLFDSCSLLQDLSLESCTWEDGQIYTIRAPMLRYLRIVNLGNIYYPSSMPNVEFDVPRLKCFEFYGEVSELYCIKSSIALAIADLTVFDIRRDCILSLIRGLSNATTVKLFEIYYREPDDDYYSHHYRPLPQLPIFDNLLELEVSLGPRDSHAILPQILQHMLSKSPKLETLVFREGFQYCYSHLLEIVECEPFIWSSQVKVIQVNDFSDSTKEVEMITFFLTKAIGLKQLNVNVAVAEDNENVASNEDDEYSD
ncbi:hypothetical protein Dimus_012530 [Dionaea muscipula]